MDEGMHGPVYEHCGDCHSKMNARIAEEAGLDMAQMALTFVNSRHFVTSNIIGATSIEQLKSNIESINLELSEDVLQAIEEVHTQQPNPSP